MMFVYSRVGGPVTAMTREAVHYGWLRGASTRGRPYPRAWVANVGRGGDIWRDMAITAPAPNRAPSAPRDGQQSYILQQDPNGLWYVDPWASNGAGTIRSDAPIVSSFAAVAAMPQTSNDAMRDMADTCYIIELDSATPR
jgi:hypothetical protein